MTGALNLDWRKIINNQLMTHSKVKRNDEIWIERPHVIKALSKLMAYSKKK
jgi:hypothetical protein